MFIKLTKINKIKFKPVCEGGKCGDIVEKKKIMVNKNNILFLEEAENNGCKITFCNDLHITVEESCDYITYTL